MSKSVQKQESIDPDTEIQNTKKISRKLSDGSMKSESID